ncbi:cell wall-binding repeat-containing protein [Peptostreptococcus russellii]|uniref:cell wall-binding repeat-containing protein n=1 Tax=Peptostreptococcus russellii TaxID=215200 RepID=UPI0026ED0A6E|nr:cell wall-binding repeat-containing protein [Peptostreptococcus russellii]
MKKDIKRREIVKKNPKYKLRKLSIGVVSFMCGISLFYAGMSVNAQEISKILDKSKWPSMIADRQEGSLLISGVGFRSATDTVQPLGGWTNPRITILPDNLGNTPAENQAFGQVIEYTKEQLQNANNASEFGWIPIGTKVGINKSGLSGVVAPTQSGARTLGQLNMKYQDGFIPNSQSETDYRNTLVLANYSDKDAYKGVYRLVNVSGEKELSWKLSTTAYNQPIGQMPTDAFKVNFYDNEKNELLASKQIDPGVVTTVNGAMMIPEGTNTIKVELVPLYNGMPGWNTLPNYGMDKNIYRYNVLINGFELYKTSRMVDALPDDEKVQIFKNGTTGIYNFTVKNESPQDAGVNGGAQIAPYLTAKEDKNTPIEALKSGVSLIFENSLPNGIVSDLKPTLYDNGMNSQTSQFESGTTKKLELKTINLTKKRLEKPQLFNVDAYKLNYSTQVKTERSVFNVDGYIKREYTENATPYHQDVVANSEDAASTYGNSLTDKRVSNLATGRSIIVLMDKTKLKEVVDAETLKGLEQNDYSPEAWKEYQDKLTRAKQILEEDESLENLKVDTAEKLSKMASQIEINDLERALPTILVKPPILTAEENGSVTATPNEDTVKMTVNYKDGNKNISVEVTKQENPKDDESAPTTYSWRITNVATIEGSNPTVNSEETPTGVTVDSNTGKLMIAESNVNDLSTVTATDVNLSNKESKEVSVQAKGTRTDITNTDAQKYPAEGIGTSYSKDADIEAKKNAIISAAKVANPQASSVAIDNESKIPSEVGGPTEVAVTLHYADGSRNKVNITVTVTATEDDSQRYPAVVSKVQYSKGADIEVKKNAIISAAKVANPQASSVTIDNESKIPSAVGGPNNIEVTLHYEDNTINASTVVVTVTDTQVDEVDAPIVKETEDGNIIITPDGENTEVLKIGFTDNPKDQVSTKVNLTANKNGGVWSLENEFPGVEINPNTGVIIITSGTAKPGTEVTAQSKNSEGNKSDFSAITVKEIVEIKAPEINVYNPFDLTDKERETLEEEIKKANTQIKDWENYEIEVNPSGNVEIAAKPNTNTNTKFNMSNFSFFRAIGGPDMVYPQNQKPADKPVYPSYLKRKEVDLNELIKTEKIAIKVPNGMTPNKYIEDMQKNPTDEFKKAVIKAINSYLEKQGWSMDRINVVYKSLSKGFELEYYVPEANRVNTNGVENVVFEKMDIPAYNSDLQKNPYKVINSSSNSPAGGNTTGTTNNSEKPSSERIAGKDRVETSLKVAESVYPKGTKTVILANKDKFTDVLVATPYSKTIKAPILYTDFNSVPGEVSTVLKKLGVENIILIGGENTISKLQQRALEGMGYKTDRVDGVDRYDTAKLISEKMKKAGAKGVDNVIIASGEVFPDALSISPLALENEIPILLSNKDKLSSYTTKQLESLKIDRIYISGGVDTVSSIVESKLGAYTKQKITRFAGKDRFETSQLITKALRPKAKISVFASGEIFPDALVAGGLVDKYNAPIMLVKRDSLPDSISSYVKDSKIINNLIVGGENSISNKVVEELEKLESR